MPVYQLNSRLVFPPVELSEPDGLLAVGGDLSPKRLLLAYSKGIFPWYSDDSPPLWWSPDPRLLLFPEEFNPSRSLRATLRKGLFALTFDSAFERVIDNCSDTPERREGGTWITGEMKDAYKKLHALGFAHSVEAWDSSKLVGGLYGVSIGRAFFGESMFSLSPDASKAALHALVQRLLHWEFYFIDCQVRTEHLVRLGAREVPRKEFLELLKDAINVEGKEGAWA